jgi:flagellar basal-body rod modification protein FlgD
MSPTTAAGTTPSSNATNPSNGSGGVTTDEFLQLLVAEVQNQDPTSPMDGTTFLTQLAEFQQVEQGVTLNQDVSGILTDTNTIAASAGGTAATQSQ